MKQDYDDRQRRRGKSKDKNSILDDLLGFLPEEDRLILKVRNASSKEEIESLAKELGQKGLIGEAASLLEYVSSNSKKRYAVEYLFTNFYANLTKTRDTLRRPSLVMERVIKEAPFNVTEEEIKDALLKSLEAYLKTSYNLDEKEIFTSYAKAVVGEKTVRKTLRRLFEEVYSIKRDSLLSEQTALLLKDENLLKRANRLRVERLILRGEKEKAEELSRSLKEPFDSIVKDAINKCSSKSLYRRYILLANSLKNNLPIPRRALIYLSHELLLYYKWPLVLQGGKYTDVDLVPSAHDYLDIFYSHLPKKLVKELAAVAVMESAGEQLKTGLSNIDFLRFKRALLTRKGNPIPPRAFLKGVGMALSNDVSLIFSLENIHSARDAFKDSLNTLGVKYINEHYITLWNSTLLFAVESSILNKEYYIASELLLNVDIDKNDFLRHFGKVLERIDLWRAYEFYRFFRLEASAKSIAPYIVRLALKDGEKAFAYQIALEYGLPEAEFIRDILKPSNLISKLIKGSSVKE